MKNSPVKILSLEKNIHYELQISNGFLYTAQSLRKIKLSLSVRQKCNPDLKFTLYKVSSGLRTRINIPKD